MVSEIGVRELKTLPETSTTRTATIAEKWHQCMKLFVKLTTTKSSEQGKCSTFLGQAGRDIYNTLTLTEDKMDKINVLSPHSKHIASQNKI